MLASQLHIGGEDLNEWMEMEDVQKEVIRWLGFHPCIISINSNNNNNY